MRVQVVVTFCSGSRPKSSETSTTSQCLKTTIVNTMRKETSMSKKKKKGRVNVGNLPQKEKELVGRQASNIKGGGGNAGASGGDVRSITQLKAT